MKKMVKIILIVMTFGLSGCMPMYTVSGQGYYYGPTNNGTQAYPYYYSPITPRSYGYGQSYYRPYYIQPFGYFGIMLSPFHFHR